ncbi:MAG: hypothetical protein R2822_21530 [Spirosomataceae bacterium]
MDSFACYHPAWCTHRAWGGGGGGSVVTKDVPAKAIVAGIPAQIVGERKSGLKYQLTWQPWFK